MRHLDINAKTITGISGKEYRVMNSITVGRFMEFEKLQQHVGWGLDFKTMFDKLKGLYELVNKGKIADTAVSLHNMMNGIAKNIDKRYHPALLLCMLFIVEDGEDLSVWDEQLAERKIEDMSDIDAGDFFQLAASLVSGFLPIFQDALQNTSEAATTTEKRKNTTKRDARR